jgi:D-alanyl-D-alanine carboxypeptidase (penicillin-binding protein 5/6)
MSTKHNHPKRWLIIGLAIVLLVSYVAYILTEPLDVAQPTITFTFSRPAKAVALTWPSYGESAVGAVGYGILASQGSNTPQATASVIKVLTALAVLKQHPLAINEIGPMITLTQADVGSYNKYLAEGGSVVRVVAGEQLSEYQALQALLIPSANNIAETLARWAFGSIDAYNAYANSYAKDLGMTNTTITDPSGFLGTTVSTPHDLVILGEAALANPVVAQIVDEPSATLPVQGVTYNVNNLLGHEDIVGIKTGNNDQDWGCYLFGADTNLGNQVVTVIGAIMGGLDLGTTMNDALPLISNTVGGFSDVSIVNSGTQVASLKTAWGSRVSVVAQANLSAVVWNNSATTVSVDLPTVQPPLKINSQVGSLKVYNLTTHTVSSVPLTLEQAINGPSIIWRLIHGL